MILRPQPFRYLAISRELRNRELRLFEIFIANPEHVFSKAQLVDRLVFIL